MAHVYSTAVAVLYGASRHICLCTREANPGAPIPGAPDRLSPDFYPGDG